MWGTSDDTRTAYLDTVDISRMILASLRSEGAHRASLTLAGPKAWTTGEVTHATYQMPPCTLKRGPPPEQECQDLA